MKITIIYDNIVYDKGLEADWGFSCLVETENAPRILFDTGTKGQILLNNMEKLYIDPASIGEVFISHPHGDHTGGLSDFLKVNKDVTVYVPYSFRKPLIAEEVVSVRKPLQIHENVFSTGELSQIEQSLVVKMEKGVAVITGCSHPKVGHILESASQFGEVHALIGGLHGFEELKLLEDMEFVCAAHCTQHKSEIEAMYSEKWIDGGAGKVIQI